MAVYHHEDPGVIVGHLPPSSSLGMLFCKTNDLYLLAKAVRAINTPHVPLLLSVPQCSGLSDASGEQGDVAQTSAGTAAGSVVTPVALRSRAASQNSQ